MSPLRMVPIIEYPCKAVPFLLLFVSKHHNNASSMILKQNQSPALPSPCTSTERALMLMQQCALNIKQTFKSSKCPLPIVSVAIIFV